MKMNEFQTNLFSDLEKLVATTEAFYRQEFKSGDHIYWVYNYRLASYSDFLFPSALWCRGTMFEVDSNGQPIRLACLPMKKFFNLNENPSTMNLDLDQIDWIEVKSDGSLISTYMEDGKIKLKSKGSISSQQAIDAMEFLEKSENKELHSSLYWLTHCGFTVNMEWVSPDNRIVLGYMKPELILLNLIFNGSGDFSNIIEVDFEYKFMRPFVDIGSVSKKEFIEQVPDMLDDIEGFIFVMQDGQRVKIKTNKYLSLHHAKDSVNNPRRLFECVIDEASDDLRSMFAGDALALALIGEMEEKVGHLYNHTVAIVEGFHEKEKHLDRKDYAIKAKANLSDLHFPLVMNLYIGRDNNYKEWMKKKYKEFGFHDISVGDDSQ